MIKLSNVWRHNNITITTKMVFADGRSKSSYFPAKLWTESRIWKNYVRIKLPNMVYTYNVSHFAVKEEASDTLKQSYSRFSVFGDVRDLKIKTTMTSLSSVPSLVWKIYCFITQLSCFCSYWSRSSHKGSIGKHILLTSNNFNVCECL